jgi:hypothetical protein
MKISHPEGGGNGERLRVVNQCLRSVSAVLRSYPFRQCLQSVAPSRMTGAAGRVAEWFKAPVLKTGVPARVPWVRIPPLPPVSPCSPSFGIHKLGALLRKPVFLCSPVFSLIKALTVVFYREFGGRFDRRNPWLGNSTTRRRARSEAGKIFPMATPPRLGRGFPIVGKITR